MNSIKLTDQEILDVAHRNALTYKHNADPTLIAYGFNQYTLLNFARALEPKASESLTADQELGVGWTCEHPKYGLWFMPRSEVVADWKTYQLQVTGKVIDYEPGEDVVNMWINEQITWIEIYHYGKQLKRPDMAVHEARWNRLMSRDSLAPMEMKPTKGEAE